MYIPDDHQMPAGRVMPFMQAYPFATLVSVGANGLPIATHLPFIVEEQAGKLILTSHMARPNPQWAGLPGQQALVIFQEPHAYISPTHYDHELNVPTWNYLAVHAYGEVRLIEGSDESRACMNKLIDTFEAGYAAQYAALPAKYKDRLFQALVMFEVAVTRLDAKAKLSQNKTNSERERIGSALSASEDGVVRDLGSLMAHG